MFSEKDYSDLNLNVSEIIDVFTNENYIMYCVDGKDLKIKSIIVKYDKDNKKYIELSGTKANRKVVYDVYEFEVYEEKLDKKYLDEKWTKALQHYFYKVFGKSFIDAYNRVYNTEKENIDITL